MTPGFRKHGPLSGAPRWYGMLLLGKWSALLVVGILLLLVGNTHAQTLTKTATTDGWEFLWHG